MNQIATSIVNRRLRNKNFVNLALEKFAIGPQDTGPGSGFSLRATSPLSTTASTFESNNIDPAAQPKISLPKFNFSDEQIANAGKVSKGILGVLSGGLGTLGTTSLAGLNRLWNDVTPGSMNTSDGWTNSLEGTVDKVVDWTNASAADVYQGLGGSAVSPDSYLHPAFKRQTGWGESQREQEQQQNLDTMPDGWGKYTAQVAEDAGEGAWNSAQVLTGTNALAAGLGRIPGAAQAAARLSTVAPRTRSAITTLTGLPLSTSVSPTLMAGSLIGQNVATTAAQVADQIAAAQGNPSQWSWSSAADLLPMNLAFNGVSQVTGPQVADLAYRAGMSASLPNQLSSAVTLAGIPAAYSAIDHIDTGSAAPQEFNLPQADQSSPQPPADSNQPTPARELRRPFVDDPTPHRPFVDDADSPPAADKAPAAPAQTESPVTQFVNKPLTPEEFDELERSWAAVPKTQEAQAAVADINSPEAQQKIQEGKDSFTETGAADYAKTTPPPTNSPQDWGEWLQGMMEHVTTSWNNMTPEAQLAFGLGVPLGVIGLLSGNVGGFLLSAVGLGAAGVAAAQSGMFGDTAQTATTPAGEKPAEPIKPLSGDEQLSVIRGLTSASDPMAYVAANKAQFDQIAKLSDDELSAVAQQFDPQARSSLIGILKQFNDKIDTGLSDLAARGLVPGRWADAVIAARSLAGGESLPPGIRTAELPQLKEKVERMLQILNSSQAAPANNTGAYIQNELMPKIARCWKGYEPVPGKKPYSEDSCRPVGSKKKKKMKKKADNYLSFLASDKPAILTLIRGYYDKQTGPQSKEVSAQGNS